MGYNIDRHKERCIYGKLKVAKWFILKWIMYLHHVAKMVLWKPCVSYTVLVMLIFMLMMI